MNKVRPKGKRKYKRPPGFPEDLTITAIDCYGPEGPVVYSFKKIVNTKAKELLKDDFCCDRCCAGKDPKSAESMKKVGEETPDETCTDCVVRPLKLIPCKVPFPTTTPYWYDLGCIAVEGFFRLRLEVAGLPTINALVQHL